MSSKFSFTRPQLLALVRHRVIGAVSPFRRAADQSGDWLQRELDAIINEAGEAGAVDGKAGLSDEFTPTVEPRLRRLVHRTPEALGPAPAVLAEQVASLSRELRELDAESAASTTQPPALRTAGIFVALNVAAYAAVIVLWLQPRALPVESTVLAGAVVAAVVFAIVHGFARFARGRAERRRARLQRRHRSEIVRLQSEIRRATRSRAQLDEWIADARRLVEAEYKRYRLRAGRAAEEVPPSAVPSLRAVTARKPETSGASHAAGR